MQHSQSPVRRLACAIYARVSSDKTGAGLAVERQEADCRALAERLNADVTHLFTDNSVSAYSGKRRPGYEALLEIVRRGEVDLVLAWHGDRLHRSMVELEDYVNASEVHGVATHTAMAGPIDLATPSGRLVARQLGAVARYEVEHAIERVNAAKLQAAKAGKFNGGNRPYGYDKSGMVINPDESRYVREAINRFISGDSWRQIALDFNARGVMTAKGNTWKAINVYNMATLPRHAGILMHKGNEYVGAWPPIISRETYEDLQLALKRAQTLYGARSYARKHLLSGFIFCALCGTKMVIINSQKRDGSYSPAFACRRVDLGGCGKVARRKDPVEHLVVESLLYRLDTPDLGALLGQSEHDDGELRTKLGEHAAQSARLQEILDAYASGDLTMSEWKTAKATAQGRLDQLDKAIAKLTSRRTIAHLPAGQTVRQAWEVGDLEWRRQLLDVLIEKVLIYPRELGDQKVRYEQWVFNPERVEIKWRA